MVRFRLFGIPVEIQPWFWVTMALLGGANGTDSKIGLYSMLVFMLIGTISILVHEFGHALVGRWLGGGHAHIVLVAFGGLAYSDGRFTRLGHFWRIAAGPGAGFALGILTILCLSLVLGFRDALNLASVAVLGMWFETPSLALGEFLVENQARAIMLFSLLWINFWWSALNLLPVLPLDGGRIAELFLKPRTALTTGAFAGTAVALYALSSRQWYLAILFGFLAYQNFQALRAARY